MSTPTEAGASGPGHATADRPPRLSVVVATYQRRELVLILLDALSRQDTDQPFEAIVVVDGSTDGTARALGTRSDRFPLTIVEQPNAGASKARNRGAELARGDVLLFLDDDMEPHPGLVRSHLDAYDKGAEAVVGAIPLHPASPHNIMAQSVGEWADELATRLAQPGYRAGVNDIFTGQLSVRRDLFVELDGFDERFTRQGTFGNSDIDFGHRLVGRGVDVVFRPDAISFQRYVVSATQFLPRWSQVGEADVRLARLHPDLTDLRPWSLHGRPRSLLARAVVRTPRIAKLLVSPFRLIATALVDGGRKDGFTRRLYALVRHVHYWVGVARAGGPIDGDRVRVLCWHSIADLSDDPTLRDYGVPADTFREQLRELREEGWAFLTADEFVRFLRGAVVPRRSVLLTFDDGYADLISSAFPVLNDHQAPAVAFAISRWIGQPSPGDVARGRRPRPLADLAGLLRLADAGIEIGSHSRTHPRLAACDDAELENEVTGSRLDLSEMGFARPRLFAYPYGDHDARVHDAARAAGYEAAFTTVPRPARGGGSAFEVPRIEIFPDDAGIRLRRKVHRGVAEGNLEVWLRRRLTTVRRRMRRALSVP